MALVYNYLDVDIESEFLSFFNLLLLKCCCVTSVKSDHQHWDRISDKEMWLQPTVCKCVSHTTGPFIPSAHHSL